MPGNTTVHYRVVVIRGTNACVSADATYMTGTVSGAPGNFTPTKGTSTVAPAPGFIIGQNQRFAYIINNQGEVVWAHQFPVSLSRALMSFDGNYMYAREVGPFNAATGGAIYRVGMDGSGEMRLTLSGGTHHNLTVTPTGIAYPAKQAAGACDSIYVAGPDGSGSRPLVDLDIVFGKFAIGPGGQAQEKCHVNAIRYYKDTDTFSVSDREKDAIAFISSTGAVLGSIGATPTGIDAEPRQGRGRRFDDLVDLARAARPRPVRAQQDRVVVERPVPGRHVHASSTTRSTARPRSSTGNTPAPAPRPRSATRNTCPTATSSRPAARTATCTRSTRASASFSRSPTSRAATPSTAPRCTDPRPDAERARLATVRSSMSIRCGAWCGG